MRNSKLIFSAAVAISAIVGVGAATAADLAARPYTKAAPIAPAPVYDWSGFYIGGELGGAWARVDGSAVFGPPATWRNSRSTGMGGGFIGYQYQFSSNIVLGIEANVVALFNQNLGLATCVPASGCTPPGSLVGNRIGDAIWSVGPRLGWAAGMWMPYLTGGYAGTRVNDTYYLPGGVVFEQLSQNRSGWYVGGGIDWAFNPNWIVGVEYRHYDFGTLRGVPTLAGGGLNPVDSQDLSLRADSVAVRVSYKFGGPVVAKY
jgi:outer membrane immunogenic protein